MGVAPFLLYHSKTFRTGKALAKDLGASCGKMLPYESEALVRWGSAVDMGRDGKYRVVLNRAYSILLASNKLAALKKWKDAGLSVPDFMQTTPQFAAGQVWLGRDLSGFGGKDIVPYSAAPCGHHAWYSLFIPNDREYRLHVVGGEVVRTQRKYLERPHERKSEYIQNHTNGYVFKAPQMRLNRDREQLAINAVKELELDFGAVDLIVDPNGKAYLLEVNTAPGCSPLTLSAYARALRRLLDASE